MIALYSDLAEDSASLLHYLRCSNNLDLIMQMVNFASCPDLVVALIRAPHCCIWNSDHYAD